MPTVTPSIRYLRAAERARQEGVDTAPAALGTADVAGTAVRPCRAAQAGRQPRIRVLHELRQPEGARADGEPARGALPALADPRGTDSRRGHGRDRRSRRIGSLLRGPPARQPDRRMGVGSEPATSNRATSSRRGTRRSRRSSPTVRSTRPPFWGGFRIVPSAIEFWYGRPGRLHERLLYTRTASGWKTGWLYRGAVRNRLTSVVSSSQFVAFWYEPDSPTTNCVTATAPRSAELQIADVRPVRPVTKSPSA